MVKFITAIIKIPKNAVYSKDFIKVTIIFLKIRKSLDRIFFDFYWFSYY